MKAAYIAVVFLILPFAAPFAEEANSFPTKITIDGVTYEDVRWGTVTPATVSIFHSTGIASIPLEKLPPELQQRFGYDPKKATEYRAAEQTAEAARQEARRNQMAAAAAERERQAQLEAEKQKQADEIAAKQAADAAAAKQAAEPAATKADEDFFARLGPVTTIRFSFASQIRPLSSGRYYTTLWYNDDRGYIQSIHVTFPEAGVNFIKSTQRSTVPNSWVLYGRPYTVDLQDPYGRVTTETAYWLVGSRMQSISVTDYQAGLANPSW
jgi:hypothetical protein